MTEAMPFLQKTILLSYDPRPFAGDFYFGLVLGYSTSASSKQRQNKIFRKIHSCLPIQKLPQAEKLQTEYINTCGIKMCILEEHNVLFSYSI